MKYWMLRRKSVKRVLFYGFRITGHASLVRAVCSVRDCVFVASVVAFPTVTSLKVPVKSVCVQVMLLSVGYNTLIYQRLFYVHGNAIGRGRTDPRKMIARAFIAR